MVLAQQARGLSIIEVDVQIHTWASTFLCKREINQLLKKYQELTKLCYMRVQPYVLLGHLYPVLSILSLIHIVLQIFLQKQNWIFYTVKSYQQTNHRQYYYLLPLPEEEDSLFYNGFLRRYHTQCAQW